MSDLETEVRELARMISGLRISLKESLAVSYESPGTDYLAFDPSCQALDRLWCWVGMDSRFSADFEALDSQFSTAL